MKIVILAGGLGTRIEEETTIKPKPMVEIGGRPLLWHIMNIYSAYNFKEFIVALGYKGEVIKDYFLNYYNFENDLTVSLKTGKVDISKKCHKDWNVQLVDTGLDSMTGGRLYRLKERLKGETFMMTYGDGLGDIDIKELVEFHKSHGKIATVTAVRPAARFGGMRFDGNKVCEFKEKPQIGEGWINGGFFVFQPEIFNYLKDESSILEAEVLESLVNDDQLMAYKHEGFWHCMDTLRDKKTLEKIWNSNDVPWRIKSAR
ncbi:MAG: glucose-1-phosphate cytidylyltransferase [Parcubacteria group bacterium]|nr:glucose-1-phosphate cytidylyltransferase [Parcubacteria group bacterium]